MQKLIIKESELKSTIKKIIKESQIDNGSLELVKDLINYLAETKNMIANNENPTTILSFIDSSLESAQYGLNTLRNMTNESKTKIYESNKRMRNRIAVNIQKSGITSHIYKDDNWAKVKELIDIINNVEGVNGVTYGAKDGGYRENSDGSGKRKIYQVEIDTIQGPIQGIITASAAGSVQDPFDRYDVNFTM